MAFRIQASCGCNMGRIRKNNEDNFFFDGKYLDENNQGLEQTLVFEDILKDGFCVAVFDGMGGENFGETASYVATQRLQKLQAETPDIDDINIYLNELAQKLDGSVVEAQQQMHTYRMGATMVCLYYFNNEIYACNIGDSRAYRLREGEFTQISYDHIERRPGTEGKKVPITQYLGYGSDEIEVEPFIFKAELQSEDVYLLCSDGLSDMLTDSEISDIMQHSENSQGCVENLIDSAMEHGGRDNITVIVCKVV